MSSKKRNPKAIQIVLTEDQIARVIQEAARTRRGLKVENLEDRIAPSRFGMPGLGDDSIPFDPANGNPLDHFGGSGDPLAGDGSGVPFDPAHGNPLDGLGAGSDPLAGGGGGIPFDPAHGNPLGGNPGSGFTTGDGSIPYDPAHGNPLGGPSSGLPDPNHPQPQAGPSADDLFQRRFQHQQEQHLNTLGTTNPHDGEVSPEELMKHRREIMRNLRGVPTGPGPDLPTGAGE